MTKLQERVYQYDMLVPFMVPAVYVDVVGVNASEDRWDSANPDREVVNITVHWGKLSLEHILSWQRDFNGYATDVDHVSSVWVKDLLQASMDPVLKRQVDSKFSVLDEYQKGGISYFKSLVDTVFNSLTPIFVWAGTKNYRSVEFLRRNSTFFPVFRNTTQPPTTTTMVSHLPLLRHGLDGYAQSNTRATRPRMSARALLLGFV